MDELTNEQTNIEIMHCSGGNVGWLLVAVGFCSGKVYLVIKKMTISQVDVL